MARRVKGLKLSFEPADIVNEVMSFGSPTPVEVAVSGIAFSGPDRAKHLAYVEKVRAEVKRLRRLRAFEIKHHGRRTPPSELTTPTARWPSSRPITPSQSGGS